MSMLSGPVALGNCLQVEGDVEQEGKVWEHESKKQFEHSTLISQTVYHYSPLDEQRDLVRPSDLLETVLTSCRQNTEQGERTERSDLMPV